jgi:hypothetical protein
MGWWQISTEPEPDSGLPFGQGGLLNRVPGEAAPTDLYNGDRPADLAGRLWDQCRNLMDAQQFAALLAVGPQPASTLPPALLAEVEETRTVITQTYLETWGRPPRPEEWLAIADFVCVEDDDEPPAAASRPPEPEAAPAEPEPYGADQWAAEIEHLWISLEPPPSQDEGNSKKFLTPTQFREAILTGRLPKDANQYATKSVTDLRSTLWQAYLEHLDREPTPREWRNLLAQAAVGFDLPDGTIVDQAPLEYLVKTLWEHYLAQPLPAPPPVRFADHLTLKAYLALVADGLPPKKFADLLADGLTTETSAHLTPDFLDLFNELRPEIEEVISDIRQAPPLREDWLAVATLAHR